MAIAKENIETTPGQTVTSAEVETKYCDKKRSEEADLIDNAKEYIMSFFQAPWDEHKACFKATWDKVVAERFQDGKDAGLEGEKIQSKN